MANMFGCLTIIILLLAVAKCFCIGIEYYDDEDLSEEKKTNLTSVSDARRVGIGNDDNSNKLSSLKPSTDCSGYVSVPNINMNDLSIPYYVMNRKKTSLEPSCIGLRENQNCHSNLTTSYGAKSGGTPFLNSSNLVLPSDIFQEYEYVYDDSNPQILRQGISQVETNTSTNLTDSPAFKTPLTEFYNLEPAVQYVHFKVYKNFSRIKDVWYTPENLPCWNLPLLYAEFGSRKKYSDVFLIHGGKLKNVIEASKKNMTYTQMLHRPSMAYYTNKWCTMEPCYGDHTLCLFSERSLSGLCRKGYKVQIPNISERTALVNTINSMRNMVANGESDRYSHLPPAANMNQIMYDDDLERIAMVWLYQCLPGPAPCSALDENFVTQLECTKYAKFCCYTSHSAESTKCIPKAECFVLPIIGCLHVWFWSAGDNITATDVQCGHASAYTYNTAQLLWAKTYKIGCASAENSNGDVRVICNFSPGAPFYLSTKLYCGIIAHNETSKFIKAVNVTDNAFLKSLGIYLNLEMEKKEKNITELHSKLDTTNNTGFKLDTGEYILSKMYTQSWARKKLNDYSNGTKAMIARLVVKYQFTDESESRCDSDESIYIAGATGSLCVERGRRYQGLCYGFRDPTPGYRLVAVVAPIALFSLILYDLFSGVVRQTNY